MNRATRDARRRIRLITVLIVLLAACPMFGTATAEETLSPAVPEDPEPGEGYMREALTKTDAYVSQASSNVVALPTGGGR